MLRLENLRRYIDNLLFQLDGEPCRNGFVHLYGVSAFAVMLARARGVDEELAAVCGMLHDIWTYATGDGVDHAVKGGDMIRKILAEAGDFSYDEIETVVRAVSRHSTKDRIDDPLDEVLKDADVLQHHLYNPDFMINPGEGERFTSCLHELHIE